MGQVAIFLPDLPVGGVERVLLNLASGLTRWASVELVLGTDSVSVDVDVPAGVGVRTFGASRTISALPPLVRYLRAKRPDVLLSAKDHANAVSVAARAIARVPTRVALTVHTPPAVPGPHRAGWSGSVLPSVMRVLYPRADVVVGVSDGIAESLVRDFGLPAAKVASLPNPVIDAALVSATRAAPPHPWCGGPIPVVLCVARLVEGKDVGALIEAVAVLRRSRDVRLLIVGDGPDRGPLGELADRRGLAGSVDFVGFVADPAPFIAHCAVLALTSRLEGLPTVLIEALALGRQVVSTDCGSGPREILDNGRLGRVIPVGDVEAIAGAVAGALDDPLPPATDADLDRYRVEVAAAHYAERLGLTPP